MTEKRNADDWSAATWEGSRRALLRQSLKLTVRQRLEALDQLTETNDRMQTLRAKGKFYYQTQSTQGKAKK